MLISLHVGAHKTATTYIQSRLIEKRRVLAKHSVGMVTLARFRNTVANRLDKTDLFGAVGYAFAKRHMSAALGRMIEDESASTRLVFSDENVAGPITSATSAAGLYPDIRRRLTAVLESLPGHDVRVFFALRSYPEFFNSIYAFRAGQRKTQDLALFREKAFARKRGWPEIVSDICAAAGPERTTVWTYEAFLESPETIAAAMLGRAKLEIFARDDSPSLPSLTSKGLAVLDRASDLLSTEEYAGLARTIARFKFDPPDEKFSMFSPEEADELRAAYALDMERVRGLGCAFLDVGDVPQRPDEKERKLRRPTPLTVDG